MKTFTLILLGAALAASSASAAVITTYNSLATFNASSIVGGSPTVTEDFNGNTSVFTTFTLLGGAGQLGHVRGFAGGLLIDQVTNTAPLQTTVVTLNGGSMTAFGGTWDLGYAGPGSHVILTVTFADTSTQQVTTLTNTSGPFFFGFTSDTPFNSVTFSSANANGTFLETFTLDNVVVEQFGGENGGGNGEIPEPSTFGMMGLAMIGLGAMRRFRSK